VDNFKIIEDKKYMWDGEEYESKNAAQEIAGKYNQDNFETKILEEDGKFLVYSRRVVTDVQVEGDVI
jgi:hypothetical protein